MKTVVVSVIVSYFLSGCAAKPLKRGAEHVRMAADRAEVQNCERVGEVIGSQGWWIIGWMTSNANLFVGARNDLFNSAAALAADRVLWRDTAVTSTGILLWGDAYRCPRGEKSDLRP